MNVTLKSTLLATCVGLFFGAGSRATWQWFTQRPIEHVVETVVVAERVFLKPVAPLVFNELKMLDVTPSGQHQRSFIEQSYLTEQDQLDSEYIPNFDQIEHYLNSEFTQPSSTQQPGNPQDESIPHIRQLPQDLKARIPAFTYNSHSYSTNAQKRFVILSQHIFQEGEPIIEGLDLIKINEKNILLKIGDLFFSVSSMEDWPGI